MFATFDQLLLKFHSEAVIGRRLVVRRAVLDTEASAATERLSVLRQIVSTSARSLRRAASAGVRPF